MELIKFRYGLPCSLGVSKDMARLILPYPHDVERMFAKQINATTISLNSSHPSPVSHPNEVAQLILDALKGKPHNSAFADRR